MTKRGLAVLLVVVALTGAGASCGRGKKKSPATTTTTRHLDTTSTTEALAPPDFDAGTAMATIQDRGKLVVGSRSDVPGFAAKNPATGELDGFDLQIAKLVAVGIFGGKVDDIDDEIEFVETADKDRESALSSGKVDVVVSKYTMTDARKKLVDFAGPYLLAQQDIMTMATDSTINDVADLNGKKVCSQRGTTSVKNLQAKAPRATIVQLPTYSECAQQLKDGKVVAVSTEAAVLAGFVNSSNGAFHLVKAGFSDEPYGIGLKKGDQVFRDFLADRLEEIEEKGEWKQAFEDTLGALGLDTPEPPSIDRYGITDSDSSSTTSSTGRTGSSTSTTRKSTTTTAKGATSTTGSTATTGSTTSTTAGTTTSTAGETTTTTDALPTTTTTTTP